MEIQMDYFLHNNNNMGAGTINKRLKRSPPSVKIERKIIEKNRRNHLKNLYSTLNSLLPHHHSKEALSLPDQIDEAVNYIKSLQTRLKEASEKKESLIERKKSYSRSCTNITASTQAAETSSSLKLPEIWINQNGSAMEVVLMSGPDTQFMFYEMIRILHDQGAQVLNANFSVTGSTLFHIVHAQIGVFGASKIIKEKLNKFVHGSSSEEELQQELWDFYELHPDETWDFPIM